MARIDFSAEPWWPTKVKRRIGGDVIQTVDNLYWMVRTIPLRPVLDARDTERRIEVGSPIDRALSRLCTLAPPMRTHNRQLEQTNYRRIKLLLTNVPNDFVAPGYHENRAFLQDMYHDQVTMRRALSLAVLLTPKTGGGGGLRERMDSMAYTLFQGGTPLSDYEEDRGAVSSILSSEGLSTPSDDDFRLLDAWWNYGNRPDIPYVPHEDHLHMMSTPEAQRIVKRLVEGVYDEQDEYGVAHTRRKKGGTDCRNWPEIANEHTLAFSTMSASKLPFTTADNNAVLWASRLLDAGAAAVSVDGLLEPRQNTRGVLRKNKQNFLLDIDEAAQQNRMPKYEQEEMYRELDDIEAGYSKNAPVTLMNTTVMVAHSPGRDISTPQEQLGQYAGIELLPMTNLQEEAWNSMMLGARERVSPYLHDLPVTALAYSGLPSLSGIGDKYEADIADGEPFKAALIGFSERDRIPAWMDHMAAVNEDTLPICLVAGQTGSGKSVFMQWLATQYARTTNDSGEKTPVIMLDLKMTSDFTPTVELVNGTIINLSDLLKGGDGVFDPMRFSKTPHDGLDLAASILMSVNPFGDEQTKARIESPLAAALRYGADHGANCIGLALEKAAEANLEEAEFLLTKVRQAHHSAFFRALVGFNANAPKLSASEGLTYIRIGDMDLNLPEGIPADRQSMTQRTTVALVKAMVYGSIAAVANRQGVVLFDEAWIFLSAGGDDMKQVGRLARSQQVFPILFTQRVSDALKADLRGFISRGVILPMEDAEEAAAALELFKLEQTEERMRRITGKAKRGDGAPNPDSYRTLKVGRKVVRGTIGLYVDLNGDAVPTEIVLPTPFLKAASTNRKDILDRKEKARVFAATGDAEAYSAVEEQESSVGGWSPNDRGYHSVGAAPEKVSDAVFTGSAATVSSGKGHALEDLIPEERAPEVRPDPNEGAQSDNWG